MTQSLGGGLLWDVTLYDVLGGRNMGSDFRPSGFKFQLCHLPAA